MVASGGLELRGAAERLRRLVEREQVQALETGLVVGETRKGVEVLLKSQDICTVFGITPAALKTRLSRNPGSLPAPFHLPGGSGLYWHPEHVQNFIRKAAGIKEEGPKEESKRGRGRPSYASLGKRKPEGG